MPMNPVRRLNVWSGNTPRITKITRCCTSYVKELAKLQRPAVEAGGVRADRLDLRTVNLTKPSAIRATGQPETKQARPRSSHRGMT